MCVHFGWNIKSFFFPCAHVLFYRQKGLSVEFPFSYVNYIMNLAADIAFSYNRMVIFNFCRGISASVS